MLSAINALCDAPCSYIRKQQSCGKSACKRGRGVAIDLGSALTRGRGVNSGSRRAACNPLTRFPLQTLRPDFNFTAETFGEL